MRLKLYCPEGWSFVSWQRLIAVDSVSGFNVSGHVVKCWNRECTDDESRAFMSDTFNGDSCFFVQSGESATLDDIADALATQLKCQVEPRDGETP